VPLGSWQVHAACSRTRIKQATIARDQRRSICEGQAKRSGSGVVGQVATKPDSNSPSSYVLWWGRRSCSVICHLIVLPSALLLCGAEQSLPSTPDVAISHCKTPLGPPGWLLRVPTYMRWLTGRACKIPAAQQSYDRALQPQKQACREQRADMSRVAHADSDANWNLALPCRGAGQKHAVLHVTIRIRSVKVRAKEARTFG
jgi:hypothetical protein